MIRTQLDRECSRLEPLHLRSNGRVSSSLSVQPVKRLEKIPLLQGEGLQMIPWVAAGFLGLCRLLLETPGVSRVIANQLLRSGTSVGANVEEAHGSQSKADFIAKMSIATKEARETNDWLRLLSASVVAPIEKLARTTDESDQLVAILTTIVKRSRESGSKDRDETK
jgi:four helix bundle protein